MKRIKRLGMPAIVCLGVLVLAMCSASLAENADPRAPRTWRAMGGHALPATFVAVQGNAVVLKGEDGVERSVPLHLLMPAEQALARQFAERMASGGIYDTKPGGGNQLATFTEGPAKGFFAQHETPYYIARMTSRAALTIQCLEDGKPVGKPISVSLGHFSLDARRQPRSRAIATFKESYPPILQPTRMTLEGTLADNVLFGSTIAFEEKAVHLWGWVEDPTGIKDPTVYTPGFVFPASHRFEPHVLVVDQKEAVKAYSVEANPLRGRVFTLPFGDIPRGAEIRQPLRSMAIKGPLYGSRQVRVDVGPSRAGEMRLIFRSHGALFNGFSVQLEKSNPALRDETCRISLVIE